MQIVIDIPDRIQYGIEKGITKNGSEASQIVLDAVKNGTPLPKGHGDLKDASKMIADLNTVRVDNYAETIEWTCNVIDSYPTIIEADKEVDE